MKLNKFKKAALATLLGVFITLAVIEIVLRILGAADSYQRNSIALHDKGAFSITTLGNSHTYGSGAPKGLSYPAQLEQLLNQRHSKKYQVINRGYGNINSSFILDNLPSWLLEDKPKIVFLMTGEPNLWNRYGYWDFLKRQNLGYQSTIMEKLDFLRFFKTYRLIELFMNRSESWNLSQAETFSNTFKTVKKTDDASRYWLGYLWLGSLEEGASFTLKDLSSEQIKEAKESLQFIFEKDNNPVAARLLAEIYTQSFENDMALNYFEKSVALEKEFNFPQWNYVVHLLPFMNGEIQNRLLKTKSALEKKVDNTEIKKIADFFNNNGVREFKTHSDEVLFLEKMASYYPGRTKTTLQLFLSAKETNPEIAMRAIERTLAVNPLSVSENLLGKAQELVQKNPALKPYYMRITDSIQKKFHSIDLETLSQGDDLLEQWVISDIERMIKLSQKAGAVVVIQTYPPFRKGGTRLADTFLRKWWEKNKDREGIQFLDVGAKLDEFFKTRNKEEFYSNQFGPNDNHLNQYGYLEIAKLMEPLVP